MAAALLLAVPVASAAAVDLTTGRPTALAGDVEVVLADGNFSWSEEDVDGAATFLLQGASAVYWEYEEVGTPPGPLTPGAYPYASPPEQTPFTIADDVALRVDFSGFAKVNVLTNGTSTLHLTPRTVTPGTPIPVVQPGGTFRSVSIPTTTPPPANTPVFRCPQGWWLQGEVSDTRGWPATGLSDVHGSGRFRIGLFSGTVSFVDEAGEEHALELGRHVVEPGVGPTEAGRRDHTGVLFIDGEGTFEILEVKEWGACAAKQTFRVDGAAAWSEASGTASNGTASARFADADVEVRGTFDVAIPDGGSPLAARYRGDGDASVFVDGVLLASYVEKGPTTVAVVTWATLAVLLLGAATKGLLTFYTRLDPSELLEHPRRRALYERVVAEPGIHKRELHRRVGGAWGPFTFHLDMLARGGYLRIDGASGYAQVFARDGKGPPGPVIPHPVPRAIYDALPADGSAVAYKALRGQLALTPQLLNHHINALAARGLVSVEGRAFGPKTARRARASSAAPLDG